MELTRRRALLETQTTPDLTLDFVSGLDGKMPASATLGETTVVLRYVPDRLTLEPAAFDAYLGVLAAMEWESLEEVAVTFLNDFSNELVPRWAQINVRSRSSALPHMGEHSVTVEERQPKWENPELLSRLPIV